jgi:hypothetical protein
MPFSWMLRCVAHLVILRSVRRLLVRANVVPSSPILVTLMMEAPSSSKTLVLTRATRRNIPEDGVLRILGVIPKSNIMLSSRSFTDVSGKNITSVFKTEE